MATRHCYWPNYLTNRGLSISKLVWFTGRQISSNGSILEILPWRWPGYRRRPFRWSVRSWARNLRGTTDLRVGRCRQGERSLRPRRRP